MTLYVMSVYQQAYEKCRSSRDQDTFFSRKQNSKLKLISGRLQEDEADGIKVAETEIN